jgi:cell wall-associated NlpC family hydrolase
MSTPFLTRDVIVAQARSWLGTPYRHQASLKGVGCDASDSCAEFGAS